MPRHAAGSLVALVVTLALSLLRPAPAASGADWEASVEGRGITCTLSELKTGAFGRWESFRLTYNFCGTNYWTFRCGNNGVVEGPSVVLTCTHDGGPREQACDGATWTMRERAESTLRLFDGTQNAQTYVCRSQFYYHMTLQIR